MEKSIPVEATDRGLLIPREVLGELEGGELEAVMDEGRIIIRRKLDPADEKARVAQALRDAGLLYEPNWDPPSPVSEQARSRLAEKLASDPPLSEMIIADRGVRA